MHHICHISTTFNLRSGSARRTTAILRGCIESGYRVSLIVGRDHDVRAEDVPGVDLHCVRELVKYVSPRQDALAPLRIASLLRRLRPDLVHTHLAKAGIIGRLAAAGCRVPIIMHTVHGPSFPARFPPAKRFFFRLLEQLLGRMTEYFVFVGRELREEYIAAGVCSEENSVVIQTGRPDAVFDRSPLTPENTLSLRVALCAGAVPGDLAVTVGRLVPSKQVEDSLLVVAKVRKQGRDLHLVVVGTCLLPEEREYEVRLKTLAEDYGISEYVHFAGFREDVLDIMEVSDAVLLTSAYEGLPNIAVEAVIAGTPIITYQVSGVREVLTRNSQGVIVPQGDIAQMAEALVYFLQQPFGLSVRGNIQDNFRESIMIGRKMKLYGAMLHTRRESAG